MAVAISPVAQDDIFDETPPPPIELMAPDEELIYDDGIPMDSDWQVRAMNLLIQSMDQHFSDREDFYTGGNMFIYFRDTEGRKKVRGPDFFLIWNTTRRPQRHYWVVWEEKGRKPNIVIELVSRTSQENDRVTKKEVYGKDLQIPEYFCFDPENDLLEGWRLRDGEYEDLATDERGWMWSEELQLWIGRWTGIIGGNEGVYPRFFDKEGNLVFTEGEAERHRANKERTAREAAEAENAVLRERIADLVRQSPAKPNGKNGVK